MRLVNASESVFNAIFVSALFKIDDHKAKFNQYQHIKLSQIAHLALLPLLLTLPRHSTDLIVLIL